MTFEVVRARAMGMCFGVRDALAQTDAVDSPDQVTIYGELVHNPAVLADLAERGFHQVSEMQRSPEDLTEIVLITAHGVSHSERDRLRRASRQIVDTTCPLVQRVHDAARSMHDRGWFVVVLGHRQHVEVRGIVGDLEQYEVVGELKDVREWPVQRIGIVCQTTFPPEQAESIEAKIRRLNRQAFIHMEDTICAPTRDRQAALERLLRDVDHVVVVGGRTSNNTAALVRKAKDAELPTLHIESADELIPTWFHSARRVGLTAGTSTRPQTINDVDLELRRIARMFRGADGQTGISRGA